MRDRPIGTERPLQYHSGRSPIHRLSPGRKLIGASALSAWALMLDDLGGLLALFGLVVIGYVVAGFSARDLWRDLRWLLLQSLIVLGLTVLLQGSEAVTKGVRTALQLLLAFFPMALVVRTTGVEAMLNSLERWLPERIGFAVGETLRFVPFFARELGELVDMQRLRGARLSASEVWRPRAWRDWLTCIALPMTLRAIEVAGEVSDAATIRGVPAPAGGRNASEREDSK